MLKMCVLLGFLSFAAYAANPVVTMKTTHGVVEIELNQEKAPLSVANFLAYVDAKFYDNTIFHRVIPGFMIQGGGFNKKMEQKTTRAPVKNEANNGLLNDTGTIAMARTSDPHSATAQFFINVENNSALNHTDMTEAGWGYAVFGKVIKGMDVVNRIKAVRTGNLSGHQNVPMDTVMIKSIRRK